MNEREILTDCLRQALASASPHPLREAQRLYDLRAAEPRVDSLRAQMMRPSGLQPGESLLYDARGQVVDAQKIG